MKAQLNHKDEVMICNLARLMEEKGVNLTQLSEDLEITQNTVRTYMKNRFSRIDCAIVVKMCRYFNCSLVDLFEIKEV